jgi:hypothetical protein
MNAQQTNANRHTETFTPGRFSRFFSSILRLNKCSVFSTRKGSKIC